MNTKRIARTLVANVNHLSRRVMASGATFRRAAAVALSLCAIPACVLDAGDAAPEFEDIDTRQDNLFVKHDIIWPSTSIPVCWENPSDSNATERAWVKESVEDTWEAASEADFKGWGKCTSTSRGVRIRIKDSGPHVKHLGKALDGVDDGMILNFTYENWSPACKKKREHCIRVNAVHEFGHALGFAHEHNRDDTPSSCKEEQQGTEGDLVIGPWDPESIMNYCNEERYDPANGVHLSKTDIEGVKLVYGQGLGGLIVNQHSDKCLEVKGGSTQSGALVLTSSCNGGADQRWEKMALSGGYSKIVSKKSGKCLTVREASTQSGALVEQRTCDGSANQAWKIGSGAVTFKAKHSSKCLDIVGDALAEGAKTEQSTCSTGDVQKWRPLGQ